MPGRSAVNDGSASGAGNTIAFNGSQGGVYVSSGTGNSAGRACVPVPGATGESYTLSPADIGHTIRVQEVASNASATSVASTSARTAVVLSTTPLYWLYSAYGNVNPYTGAVGTRNPRY